MLTRKFRRRPDHDQKDQKDLIKDKKGGIQLRKMKRRLKNSSIKQTKRRANSIRISTRPGSSLPKQRNQESPLDWKGKKSIEKRRRHRERLSLIGKDCGISKAFNR